jgi:energy-coupling factor transporter ATP-binding protein EcfA2
MEETPICPYTGLRPFTEDESLYFKGRDEHITQATNQLAKNKFIMLTGASGDGKSSLVYAGIVPNAKAGFLRSQFSNWVVADFRPERNPLGNLSHTLAKQMGIANETTVRTELSHGFSALVDVYKASPLYLDTVEEDFSTLDDQQKSKRKRTAANLIIIADQFEEFFTNPENFHKGVPSQEASLVTNLLLETARIALEEKLPIYVIITMRSDFIGQCASFRGLPEAIGFSQFFVPRLNRTQLQEVIEEPAVLSGNKISRRLTERLIYDMVEGTDQLPILQHALNQIWKMANEGRSEMDLLHYAMVGGMKGTELQEKEAADFEKWFRDLPANIQACYQQPGLQNVLNTHANKLNNFALSDKNVNEADTQQIVETAFKCLTKIDNSRAVRNRMTLNEITAIINQPHLDYKKVGQVLSIFRESGNTLLRPFIDEVPELSGDSVLDITHESLIRNWENLAQWAKDEFNSYTIYLDFSQQLNRWVDSDKANSFLLYIGPLTFFENWFEKAKPNTEWIARYLGEELDHEQRQAKATSILNNANEFLQRSARKHAVTRAVMKYGPRKIAAAFAILAFIGLSSFAFKTYLDRRNVAVLENIKQQSYSLFNNPKLYFADRAVLATEQMRSNITTLPEIINNINDPLQKIVMANGIAAALVFEGRTEPAREIAQAIAVTDSLLSAFKPDFTDAKKISSYLKEVNEWRTTLGLAYFYNPTEQLMQLQQKNARRAAEAVLAILQDTPRNFEDILGFNTSLETALNFNSFSEEELKTVIQSLSPFEASAKTEWVTTQFKRDKLLIRGYQGYGFNFNGLYQELALLYAADGNLVRSLQAIDTLLKYNEPYYQRDYTNMLDNAANVASVLYRNGNTDLVDAFVTDYCQHKKMSEIEFYQRLLGRAQPYNLSRNSNYQGIWPEAHNTNLSYGEEKEITFFYQKFREAANRSANPNEQNFLLALSFKDQAITIAHKAEVAGKKYNQEVVSDLFDKSVVYHNKVDANYLDKSIDQAITASADLISAPRSRLFLFPDLIYPFVPQGARDYHFNYMSVSFMDYLIEKNLLSSYYKETAELKLFESWLTDYHYHVSATDIFMRQHADFDVLAKIEKALAQFNAGDQVDLNLLYLYLGSYAVDKGDLPLALQYYSKLKAENFGNLLRFKIGPGIVNTASFRLIGKAFTCYLQNNKPAEAKRIIDFFRKPVNRSSLYAAAARDLSAQKVNPPLASALLDSAIVEMNRLENLNSEQPNRFRITIALLTQSPTEQSIEKANGIIKNQTLKLTFQQRMARALAYRGELFKATEVIPGNISETDQLEFLWNIVRGYAESIPTSPEWREYEERSLWYQRTNFLPYVDETN